MANLRILVTGGAGFIGSNFIRMAMRDRPNWTIINFDLLTYAGNLQSLEVEQADPRYKFIKGDIASRDDLEKAFSEQIDVIVNFAAETHVDKSLYDASRFLRANLLGVGAILDLALKYSVSKLLHISTDEVYGSVPDGRIADEEFGLRPGSPYAASKAAADLLCLSYFNTHGSPIVITRASNNYGPYQFPEKVIPFFITEALAGRKLPLYGTGSNIRNWLHVDDNCRAVLLLIDKGAPGEIYNIGGDNYFDNLTLTRRLLEILGLPESRIKLVEDRPGHDLRYAIDSFKIRALGWAPSIDFDEGLRSTVQWYKSRRDWWQNILSGEHRQFYERHYENR